jgi:predicted amino acid racemase
MVGDFNHIHSPKNRNGPRGNMNEMMLFNDIINHLDLVEVPLKSRAFTWSNMQHNSLLEKLDWVFTSSSWTASFRNTMAYHLPHVVSDHILYVIQMESMVPRSNIFHFENYWVSFPDFMPTVQYYWNLPSQRSSQALIYLASLKCAEGD